MKININNYEAWMIDYIEGNLSAADEKELSEFLTFHPELKAELDLFSQTKLEPDTTIIFANKQSLKKAEGGRVITMFSWVKYSAAVAAVMMLFVGVRMYNGSKQQMVIQPYHYENSSEAFAFDRPADHVNETAVSNDVKMNKQNYFAGNTKLVKNKIPASSNEVKESIKREINPIQNIEYAKAKSIKVKDYSNEQLQLNPIVIEEEVYFASNEVKQTTTVKNVTDISLNDNKTVVDWWIDAVAIGGELGGVVEGVRDYDFNPFEKKESAITKTRNINILGFSYYSRKK